MKRASQRYIIKCTIMTTVDFPERGRRGTERIFEEIIAENLPILMNSIYLYI